MSDNPLVADPVDMSTPFSGAFVLEDIESLVTSIQNNDWLGGTLSGVALAADTVAAVSDPIGSLIAHGLGWLLEHMEPLRGWFNDLAGDPGEVAGYAQTWANIAQALAGSATDIETLVRELDGLEGETIEAYRRFQADAAKHLAGASDLADGISAGMELASMAVKVVHDLARDALAELVGTAISAALELTVTFGLAAPLVIEQVATKAFSLVARVGKTVTRLLRAMGDFGAIIARAQRALDVLVELFQKALRRGDDAPTNTPGSPTTPTTPGGPGSPGSPGTPNSPSTPDTPGSPSSPDTPGSPDVSDPVPDSGGTGTLPGGATDTPSTRPDRPDREPDTTDPDTTPDTTTPDGKPDSDNDGVPDEVDETPGGSDGSGPDTTLTAPDSVSPVDSNGADISHLLDQSTLNPQQMTDYLSTLEPPSLAEDFAATGVWPGDVQIPRGPEVLNPDGTIDWSQAPQGGYALDGAGNAIRTPATPSAGDVLDRYGPPDGRYTSPVPPDGPYPYDQRSLPYVQDPAQYHQYRVVDDLTPDNISAAIDRMDDGPLKTQILDLVERYGDDFPAYEGPVGQAFGEPGGGVQVQLPLTVEQLEGLGLLELIKP